MSPIRSGVAIACAALALAPVESAMSAGQASVPRRAPAMIYAKTCGYCHGQYVGPIIRGRKLPPELTVQFVRTGPGPMPAFRQTEITDVELQQLAKWIRDSKADPKEHAE